MIYIIKLIFFIYIFLGVALPSHALTGKVVRVADGDTVTVLTADNQQKRIRLYGIDAPEKRQAFGQKSRQTLAGMVAGKTVDVDVIDVDRYGRSVGIVIADGVNANREMVKSGMAWVYARYCKKAFCREWEKLEQNARRSGKGLWRDSDPTPPWEWRSAKRNR